jgi:hypothetical protein
VNSEENTNMIWEEHDIFHTSKEDEATVLPNDKGNALYYCATDYNSHKLENLNSLIQPKSDPISAEYSAGTNIRKSSTLA